MAEMRSSVTPVNGGLIDATNSQDEMIGSYEPDNVPTAPSAASKAGSSTFQQAQARSRRVYQRPTKRRQPKGRDEADKARDSIIDQIMHESQVPHYDQSAPQGRPGDEAEDNDAAVAEAFKADLLADLEKQRRRPALKNAGAATGPKLGGSRAQRERMRAIEEAKKGSAEKK